VLVLAADEGVRVQTRRHALLLSMLGIHTVIVAANKMDLAGRSEQAFRTLEEAILAELRDLEISASAMIPVVAQDGDNVVSHSSAMPWYTGPSVVEALGEVEPASAGFDAVRFPVQDVYRNDVSTVVGTLLSGTIAEGDPLIVCPSGAAVKVRGVRRFPENHAPAEAGESVGLILEGDLPDRGDILAAADDLPRIADQVSGRVFWLGTEPLALGEVLSVRCVTQSTTVRVEEIADRLDSATLDALPAATTLARMELGTVRLAAGRPLVSEPFARLPGLGRFVLERAGTPVGFGIIP